jgi:hypothetical protein
VQSAVLQIWEYLHLLQLCRSAGYDQLFVTWYIQTQESLVTSRVRYSNIIIIIIIIIIIPMQSVIYSHLSVSNTFCTQTLFHST